MVGVRARRDPSTCSLGPLSMAGSPGNSVVHIQPRRVSTGHAEQRMARHFHRPVEHPFTAEQRADTTVLFGGLSPRHDRLIQGVLRGLGYNAQALPNVSLDGYERAKE